MQKQILALFFFLIVLNANAQNQFAPVGAVWHYTWFDFSGIGDQRIYSESDTIVDGKQCRKIFIDGYFHNFINNDTIVYEQPTPFFVYDSLGIYYVFQESKFKILYNFNIEPGNYWTTDLKPKYGCDAIGKVFVDSSGVDLINNVSLKWIAVHDSLYNGDYFIPDKKIYEKLGSLSFLFPYPACVAYEFGYDFRCYQDSTIDDSYMGNCDFVISNVSDLDSNIEINISPIPMTDNLNLKFSSPPVSGSSIQIKTITGLALYNEKVRSPSVKIDVSKWNSGVYFLSLQLPNGIQTFKLIKQ